MSVHRPTSLAATAVLTIGLVVAAGAVPASATTAHGHPSRHDLRHDPGHSRTSRHGFPRHAVFVQNDDPAGNTVVAYARSRFGTLHEVGRYPTGGLGGVLAGSVVDHLASEGSLGYDDGLLVAVNAGSNTITTFAASGDRLAHRQVLPSGGSFPVSVAVSGERVFVLNARDGGSIQGYLRFGDRLVMVPGWHRDLGLDPHQTPEFTSTPGQIGFTPDGRRLVVTTKNGSNAVLVFGLGRFGLSATPVTTSLPGAVPFGFDFDAHGNLVLTEAGTNSVATFRVLPSGGLVPLTTAATGQAATCWAVVAGRHVYASNAGSANLSGYAISPFGGLTATGLTATDAGTVDATTSPDGRFLDVQTGAAGIVDTFAVHRGGVLTQIGSVTVPNAVGGEGIAAD